MDSMGRSRVLEPLSHTPCVCDADTVTISSSIFSLDGTVNPDSASIFTTDAGNNIGSVEDIKMGVSQEGQSQEDKIDETANNLNADVIVREQSAI